MLDCHQHFWMPAGGDYGWMGEPVAALRRDYLPEDLVPLLDEAGITRTIAVQAADTEAETDFLLGLAAQTAIVAGVVGWLDLDSDAFPARLAHYRARPGFVGLRPMLQDLAEDDWILRPRVLDSLGVMAEAGVPIDILTFPRHLPHVAEALRRTPGLRAVVDHLSKPPLAAGTLDPWREDIAAVAAFATVSCKVSGLATESGSGEPWGDQARPFVEHVATVFGADRLIFGSDWPVSTLRAGYREVFDVTRALLAEGFGPDDLDKIFARNGAAFYGV